MAASPCPEVFGDLLHRTRPTKATAAIISSSLTGLSSLRKSLTHPRLELKTPSAIPPLEGFPR